MPTYVYRREDGTTFELVQRISEDPLTIDPETGQRVQRVISGAGLIFKGTGFYLTDYAAAGKKTEKEDKSEAPVSPDKSTAAEPKKKTKSEPAKKTTAEAA